MHLDEVKAMMMNNFERYYIQSLKRSWFMTDKAERKLRLTYVIKLSVELDKIRTQAVFSTRLGEGAIEQIIEGNYHEARRYADDFTFDHDGPEVAQQYGPLWNNFRELLVEVYNYAIVLDVMKA